MLLRRRVSALVCVAALALTLTSCRDDTVAVPTFETTGQEITVTNPDRPAEIRGLLDEIAALLARIRALLDPAPQPDPEPQPQPEPDEPLVAPTGLRATVDSATRKVRLDWDAHENATVIVESAYQDRRVQVGMTDGNFSDRGPLEPGRYLYHVAARSASGVQSPDSEGVEVIIGAAPGPPPPAPAPGPAPAPEPAPPGGKVTVGSRVLFDGRGAIAKHSNLQTHGHNGSPGSYSGPRVTPVPSPRGPAIRFEIRDGDSPPPDMDGGQRTELRVPEIGNVRAGDERWYEFSAMFEPGFRAPTSGWFIWTQWHTGSGSPLLTLNVLEDGRVTLFDRWSNPRTIMPNVDAGRWHDYVVHARFGTGDDAWQEVWLDGKLVVPRVHQPNMKSAFNYLKFGGYRDEPGVNRHTQILTSTGVRITAP